MTQTKGSTHHVKQIRKIEERGNMLFITFVNSSLLVMMHISEAPDGIFSAKALSIRADHGSSSHGLRGFRRIEDFEIVPIMG